MDTTSFWQSITKRATHYPALDTDLEVDTLIIGGGITGLTAAVELAEAGKQVAVVDAYQIGGSTTGSSTGNLYVAVQPYYQNIVKKWDLKTAKTVADSREFAINYIEKNIQEKLQKCTFHRRPWYAYANHKQALLNDEVETLKRLNIPIEYVNELPFELAFKKAAFIPNQARFNPLEYVLSMAEYFTQKGGYIFENTFIKSIEETNICIAQTQQATIKAKTIFLATHTPIGINLTQAFVAPYRSYVIAARLKNNTYPEGHVWNLDGIAHTICTHAIFHKKPEILMVSGHHHKTGQGDSDKHFKQLTQDLKKKFAIDSIDYMWSAQHFQAADDIPYIGLAHRSAKNTYMATGYFADGLVYGTLAGIIISHHLLNKKETYLNTFKANRTDYLASASFLLKENANVFWQYLKDLPQFSSKQYQDVKAGEGKIVEINGEKCAVSRDQSNKLNIVSAVCTHMKCIVNWNSAEQTWDCPCHGSRFTSQGKVIEGPALSDLKTKE